MATQRRIYLHIQARVLQASIGIVIEKAGLGEVTVGSPPASSSHRYDVAVVTGEFAEAPDTKTVIVLPDEFGSAGDTDEVGS